jgi:hypothetical protein
MFDEDMKAYDTDAMFILAKKLALSLDDERTPDILTAFKQQTDVIVNNIYDTYEHVLGRHPDEEELAQHVCQYRVRANVGRTSWGTRDDDVMISHEIEEDVLTELNRMTESNLVSSLEFHDIVKDKLRQTFAIQHGAPHEGGEATSISLSSKVLYSMLSVALNKIESLSPRDRTVANVDTLVSECVH